MREDSLDTNERIFAQQRRLIVDHHEPVLSCRLRLPGELSGGPEGRAILLLLERDVLSGVNGEPLKTIRGEDWLLFCLKAEPEQLKAWAVKQENSLGYGSFVDIDVLSPDGRAVSRKSLGLNPRPCLVCKEPAKVCIRKERHSREEVVDAFKEALEDFFLGQPYGRQARMAAEAAVMAALFEVASHPSPGLVSPFGPGSHDDMDFGTFIISSVSLTEVFASMYAAGEGEKDPVRLFTLLRAIGSCGERKMFRRTGGVNTQKGLIFTMGLLLGAAGAIGDTRREDEISSFIRAMCQGLVERDFSKASGKATAGEKAFREYGITGIRGEAEKGFPSVFRVGLPALRKALGCGLSLNDSLVQCLLEIMAVNDDTTLVRRGGPGGLQICRESARDVLARGGMYSDEGRRSAHELDNLFCRHRLSAGGSADLLAASLFLVISNEGIPALMNRR